MRLWRKEVSKKKCEIPYCGSEVSKTVRTGKNLLRLCEMHFRQTTASVETKKKIDENWFTEERKMRVFNATQDEKMILNLLVTMGVLEHHLWREKDSYRPTEKFSESVAQAQIDLLTKGYFASTYIQMEEGAKIALMKNLPNPSREETEKYTELICPFILFDRMDRDLNPDGNRYKHGERASERMVEDSEVEESVQRWLRKGGYKVQKYETSAPGYWAYLFRLSGGESPKFIVFKSGIGQIVMGTALPWPSFDAKDEREAEDLKKMGLTAEKSDVALLTLKQKMKEIGCVCTWIPGRRSVLSAGRSFRYEELSEDAFLKSINNATQGANIYRDIVSEFHSELPPAKVSESELEHEKTWELEKRNEIIEEKITKWLTVHGHTNIEKLVSKEADFGICCQLDIKDNRLLFVFKPKDKVDQIRLSLPYSFHFNSKTENTDFLDIMNRNEKEVLTEIRENLEKIGCNCILQRFPDGRKATITIEKNIFYSQLSEAYFFKTIRTLFNGLKIALIVASNADIQWRIGEKIAKK